MRNFLVLQLHLLSFLLCFGCNNDQAVWPPDNQVVIGLIGAMGEEVDLLKEELGDRKEVMIADHLFFTGSLNGKEVVLVASGAGKVNITKCVTTLVERFQAKKFILIGVAGALDPSLDIGDFVVSQDLIQHDVDCTALDFPPGQMCWMDHYIYQASSDLVLLAMQVIEEDFPSVSVIRGRVLSGDQFIHSTKERNRLRETFQGDCTEMEGAALAQVLDAYQLPFVVIRSIADKADGTAPDDFKKFLKMAAERAEKILLHMLELL